LKTALTLRGIVFSSLFSALLVALSMLNIQLGFSPVPITLENFSVMLTGALLGARYGFFSIGLVVGLTALGLPLLHGNGGLGLLLGPTGGYIWAFPFSALLIGWFVPRIKGNKIFVFSMTFLAMFAFGSLLLYITGVPWLAHVARYPLDKALMLGCYPFLPGDIIKALVATAIVMPVRQLFPLQRLIGTAQTRNRDMSS